MSGSRHIGYTHAAYITRVDSKVRKLPEVKSPITGTYTGNGLPPEQVDSFRSGDSDTGARYGYLRRHGA